jgi:outer membrane immunogenic protein
LGGGQLGYNYQFARNWVAGVELDGTWTRLHASGTTNFPPSAALPTSSFQAGSNVDWLASARARLGFAWDNNWLPYVTGGYAWRGVRNSANFSCPGLDCLAPDGIVAPGSGTSIEGTWVLGGRAEWRPTGQNWSLGVEYLYYGFNTTQNFQGALLNAATGAQVSFGACNGAVPCNLSYSVKDSAVQVVRARINWMFAP